MEFNSIFKNVQSAMRKWGTEGKDVAIDVSQSMFACLVYRKKVSDGQLPVLGKKVLCGELKKKKKRETGFLNKTSCMSSSTATG